MRTLSPEDRRIIFALLHHEISQTPRARSLNPVGCLVFLVALGLFVSLSVLTRRWALPGLVRSGLFLVIVTGLGSGVWVIFFGGGSGESRARASAMQALDHLCQAFPQSSAQENMAAAVRLLLNAHYSGGPWTMSTVDVDGAREQLERAGVLEWVQQIEGFLVSEQRIQPVFTLARQE